MVKKEIEFLMKRGKTVSTSSFLCKFTVDYPEKMPENGLKQGYYISALSPKSQFKTAALRNKARRKVYGAINLLPQNTQNATETLFRAIIIPNKTLFSLSHSEIQAQIMTVFSKIGV